MERNPEDFLKRKFKEKSSKLFKLFFYYFFDSNNSFTINLFFLIIKK